MTMSDKERAEIRRHVSDREKLAKALAAERSAILLAEFEKEISAIYKWSDSEVWTDAKLKAEAALAEASRVIDQECDRLGIPKAFRPGLHIFWSSRGENAVKARCVELRRVAKAEIDRIEKQAKAAIEHAHLEARVKLVEIGLHSPDARKFLAELPAIETLMPRLEFGRIEQLMLKQVRSSSRYSAPEIGADAETGDVD